MSLIGFLARDAATNKALNQLKVDNFVNQLRNTNIITEKNADCEKKWGFFNKMLNPEKERIYYLLYKKLIEQKVIIQTMHIAFLITFDYVQKIDPNLTLEQLKTAIDNIKKTDKNFDCYNIDVNALFDFFKTYENRALDEVERVKSQVNDALNQNDKSKKIGGRKTKRNKPLRKKRKTRTTRNG